MEIYEGGKVLWMNLIEDYPLLKEHTPYECVSIDGDYIILQECDGTPIEGRYYRYEFVWTPFKQPTSHFNQNDRIRIVKGKYAGKIGRIELCGAFDEDGWKACCILDGMGSIGLFKEEDLEYE